MSWTERIFLIIVIYVVLSLIGYEILRYNNINDLTVFYIVVSGLSAGIITPFAFYAANVLITDFWQTKEAEKMEANAQKSAEEILAKARNQIFLENQKALKRFEDYKQLELKKLEQEKEDVRKMVHTNYEFMVKRNQTANEIANLVYEYYVIMQKILLVNQKILKELQRKQTVSRRAQKKFDKLQEESLKLKDEIITDKNLKEVIKQKILSYDPIPKVTEDYLDIDEFSRLILVRSNFWQKLDANLQEPAIPPEIRLKD